MSSISRTGQSIYPRLSVLDLVHLRSDQSTADAVAATASLAQEADRLGYTRFWIAEHHNIASTAATSPPILVSVIAAATRRIRVGSGGVLLPNHAPLALAEQFALLEAAYPGRIDLGVGRAAGGDALTSAALGSGHGGLDELLELLAAEGAQVMVAETVHMLKATPNPASIPPVWLLGASESSARTAAQKSLPYVFGHHLGVGGTAAALSAYRSAFKPSSALAKPRTLLPVRASVAETSEEARRAALPWLLVMLGLLTGRERAPMRTIEEAEELSLTQDERETVDRIAKGYVIGDVDRARDEIAKLAATYRVDEVMIHPIAGAHAGGDPRVARGQEQTLRLLAESGVR
ncbi:UNVERIFIED_ORG: luciferase family oxidoreductase group 1 [Gordonia westfalica J30]